MIWTNQRPSKTQLTNQSSPEWWWAQWCRSSWSRCRCHRGRHTPSASRSRRRSIREWQTCSEFGGRCEYIEQSETLELLGALPCGLKTASTARKIENLVSFGSFLLWMTRCWVWSRTHRPLWAATCSQGRLPPPPPLRCPLQCWRKQVYMIVKAKDSPFTQPTSSDGLFIHSPIRPPGDYL